MRALFHHVTVSCRTNSEATDASSSPYLQEAERERHSVAMASTAAREVGEGGKAKGGGGRAQESGRRPGGVTTLHRAILPGREGAFTVSHRGG